MKLYRSLYERIVANTAEPAGEADCWRWTGRTDGKRGGQYGRLNVRVNGKHTTLQAHRAMMTILVGRALDPVNETVEHLCREPRCCNPDHLVLLPLAANAGGRRSPCS